mgnify:CR=1 FL=1
MKVKYDVPGSEVEKLFVLARKSFYISDPPKHEKEAIYKVNERNSNVCRIAGAAKLRSNSRWHHKQQRANPKYKIIQEAKKWKLYY